MSQSIFDTYEYIEIIGGSSAVLVCKSSTCCWSPPICASSLQTSALSFLISASSLLHCIAEVIAALLRFSTFIANCSSDCTGDEMETDWIEALKLQQRKHRQDDKEKEAERKGRARWGVK